MRNYIFIVGSGRCGTTALADMLGKHDSISHTTELKFFSYAMAERKSYEPFTLNSVRDFFSEKALEKLLKHRKKLEHRRNEIIHNFNNTLSEDVIRGLSDKEVYKFVLDFLVDSFQDKSSDNVVLQTPSNLYYLDLAKEILGNIKVIGMIRDPKNFLVSAMRGNRKWYNKDKTAIVQWNLASEYLDKLSKSNSFDFILIKQEDLLLKPDEVIDRLSEFLSIDLSILHEKEKLTVNSAFSQISTQEDILKRYQKYLSKLDILRIEYLSRNYMKIFSYNDFQSNFGDIGILRRIVWKSSYYISYIKLKVQIFMRQVGRVDYYFRIKEKFKSNSGKNR